MNSFFAVVVAPRLSRTTASNECGPVTIIRVVPGAINRPSTFQRTGPASSSGFAPPDSRRPSGTKVPLRPQELLLLQALARELGVPISHRELIDEIWSHGRPAGRNDLPSVVTRLRKLLGEPARMVRAAHGFGYLLSVDPPSK